MDPSDTLRNKCAACYRQFNRMEHLVEHMRTSYHSVHEPLCGICGKRCRSFESLREHLIGPLPKAECERVFRDRGCSICLNIFSSRNALRAHRDTCQLSCGNNGLLHRFANLGIQDDLRIDNGKQERLHLPAKWLVVVVMVPWISVRKSASLMNMRTYYSDPMSNHTFRLQTTGIVSSFLSYSYETTGIRPEYLRDAMPLRQVQRKIQDFLCNGEPIWKIRPRGGKARILVGHGLDHDLKCLELEDTANYPPLMKTSKLSNSLKYLTKAYLGYDIQIGIQDPYDDCVATMRLYRRMRSQAHRNENYPLATDPQNKNNFSSWRQSELERMSPDELLAISRSDYYCWCLDNKDYI
ncbi:hypothetical protein OSB04_027058 [Centaurea solstitialis]|uniref:C2H2-type domain-containing protein n=1 Tax=Centaurea solstitialis TaxID=347529 RepID=A0AA38SWL3_9ASTR|nr:hypothetical protein OSB04_027058 [Centaurea solstitialis]